MTYQQAGRIAVLKRIAGWAIFIPAVISTLISVLKFMYDHSEKQPGINAVMLDFVNFFWFNSPTPNFHQQANVGFWVIYALIFIAMALQASGARMSRQTRFLREGVEDQLILEQAKGPDGMSREQIESRIVVPRHTIFLQIFPLYVLPVVIIVAGYFFFSLLGFI